MELNPPEAARNLQVPAEREDPPLINLDTTILEDLELAPPMVPLRAEGDVVPPVPLRAEGDVVPPVPPPVMVGNPVPPSSLGAIPRIVSAGPTSGRPLEFQLDALKQKNAGESAEIPNPSYENALHLFYYTNKQIEYKKHEVGQYAYETSLVKSLELCKMELVKSLVQPIKERYTPFSVLPRCISNELPRIVEMLTEDLKHNRSQQLGLVKVATDYVTMLAQHEPDTMIRIVDAVKPRVKVMRSQVFTKNPQLNMAILMLLKALLTNTSICHALLPNIEISTLMMQSLMWATEQKSEEAFEAGAEILWVFISKVQRDDYLLETFVKTHFLDILNRIVALYSHGSDSSSYQKLLASLLHLLDTEKRFGPERTRREDVVENLTEYLSSATLLEKDEVSKNLSKLIFSTRSDKGWPDFIKSLRELAKSEWNPKEEEIAQAFSLEGGREGFLLEARAPSRVTKSPGRSPGSQKKAMEIFPEPGPSSSRTPQRKLRVESEEEEEEEKKEVKRYNRAAKKSPGRLPPIFVDSASEEESEGEDEEAASAKSRRRSRSLTRASKKTGATTRAASASSSRYKTRRSRFQQLQSISSSDEERQGKEETASSRYKVAKKKNETGSRRHGHGDLLPFEQCGNDIFLGISKNKPIFMPKSEYHHMMQQGSSQFSKLAIETLWPVSKLVNRSWTGRKGNREIPWGHKEATPDKKLILFELTKHKMLKDNPNATKKKIEDQCKKYEKSFRKNVFRERANVVEKKSKKVAMALQLAASSDTEETSTDN